MSILILDQAREFLVMGSCGVVIGLLSQVYGFYQRRYKPARGISFFQDMLFWLLLGLLISAFLYYCCFGNVTFYGLAGGFLGLLLWRFALGKIFRRLFLYFYDIIKK